MNGLVWCNFFIIRLNWNIRIKTSSDKNLTAEIYTTTEIVQQLVISIYYQQNMRFSVVLYDYQRDNKWRYYFNMLIAWELWFTFCTSFLFVCDAGTIPAIVLADVSFSTMKYGFGLD